MMNCEFARHYEQANGKPLACDNCPKENTRHCEKELGYEVEHGKSDKANLSTSARRKKHNAT